jgi:hypothetical protein
MTTPGVTPVQTDAAIQFCQSLVLPTQRAPLLGSPEGWSDDPIVHAALQNVHGQANESAEKIARITQDLTVTTPVRHDNAAKVAKRLAEAAEATQRVLKTRSDEYFVGSREIMETRFQPNTAREGVYMRCIDWIANQAKNPDNGYTKIREAVTDDPDFALAMYNYNWRLMGLPQDHADTFKEKVVEKFAPEALDYIERSHKLGQLERKYPAFIASVHSSFYSPIEVAKMRTRFNG